MDTPEDHISLIDLNQRIGNLKKQHRYGAAIDELLQIIDAGSWSSEQETQLLQMWASLQQEQQKSFHTLVADLEATYLSQMRPISQYEIGEIEKSLERLELIDPQRPLDDLRRKCEQLRSISQVDWELTETRDWVSQQLNWAATVNDLQSARETLEKLGNELIPNWEAREEEGDALATQLLPRLRGLRSQAERDVEALSRRTDILTTKAGEEDFWQIEEEYQRWLRQEADGLISAPKTMPLMGWDQEEYWDEETQGKRLRRRYRPIGEPRPLQEWHDRFLDDAAVYAREKAERDLKWAEEALNAGRPRQAEKLLQRPIEGDPDTGVRCYFNLPADLQQRISGRLVSSDLETAKRRLEDAERLLAEADALRGKDVWEAWDRYRQALALSVDVTNQAAPVRRLLLPDLKRAVRRLVETSREDIEFDPARALTDRETIQERMLSLPEPDSDEASCFDPDGILQAQYASSGELLESSVYESLERHVKYCSFVQRLDLASRELKSVNLEEAKNRLSEIEAEITGAGFKGTDFRLFAELDIWVKNEQDIASEVHKKLEDQELFPPDPSRTDIDRLQKELRVAQESAHPELQRLAGALEARYNLYQDVTGSCTLEYRKALLQGVLDKKKHALNTDRRMAQRRLDELQKLEAATAKQREAIESAAAWADGTLDGFKRSWVELNKILEQQSVLGSNIAEIRAHIRERAEKAANDLPNRLRQLRSEQDVRTAESWMDLLDQMALWSALAELRSHFDPHICRWQAAHEKVLWNRLQALQYLSEAEPDAPERWAEKWQSTAAQWVVVELERIREGMALGPGNTETEGAVARPEDVVTRLPALQNYLQNHGPVLRKVAEVYVWLRDLPNARHYSNQAKRRDVGDDLPKVPSAVELEHLLTAAEFVEWLEKCADNQGPPSGNDVRRVQRYYDNNLFKDQEIAYVSPGTQDFLEAVRSKFEQVRQQWVSALTLRLATMTPVEDEFWQILIMLAHLDRGGDDREVGKAVDIGLQAFHDEHDSTRDAPPSARYLITHLSGQIVLRYCEGTEHSPLKLIQKHMELVQQKQRTLARLSQFMHAVLSGRSVSKEQYDPATGTEADLDSKLRNLMGNLEELRGVLLNVQASLDRAKRQESSHSLWVHDLSLKSWQRQLPAVLRGHIAASRMEERIQAELRFRQNLERCRDAILAVSGDDSLTCVERALSAVKELAAKDPKDSYRVLRPRDDEELVRDSPELRFSWSESSVPLYALDDLDEALRDILDEQKVLVRCTEGIGQRCRELMGPLVVEDGLWESVVRQDVDRDQALHLWRGILDRWDKDKQVLLSKPLLELEQNRRNGFFGKVSSLATELLRKRASELSVAQGIRSFSEQAAETLEKARQLWGAERQWALGQMQLFFGRLLAPLEEMGRVRYVDYQQDTWPPAELRGIVQSSAAWNMLAQAYSLQERIDVIIEWIEIYRRNADYWSRTQEELHLKITRTDHDKIVQDLIRQMWDLCPDISVYPRQAQGGYVPQLPPLIS